MPDCVVQRCRRQGTADLPIGDEETLDVPICEQHRQEIAADPSGWRITSIVERAGRARTVVVRVTGS